MSAVLNTSSQPEGMLAKRHSNKSLPVLVLKSHNGYYLGTYDLVDGPCSRESVQYWPTEAEASYALNTGRWTQRTHP